MDDVSPDYDETRWTWPDWYPTPWFEALIDRVCLFLFGGGPTSDDATSPPSP